MEVLDISQFTADKTIVLAHPILTKEQRSGLRVDDPVKLIVRLSKNEDCQAKQLWFKVTRVDGDSPSKPFQAEFDHARYINNPKLCNLQRSVQFGPQHVYRMPTCRDVLTEDGFLWQHQGDFMTRAEGRWRFDKDLGLVPLEACGE